MQSLSWYLNRLRCMSAAEIGYRSVVTAQAIREGIRKPRELAHICRDPLAGRSSRGSVRFFFDAQDLQGLSPLLHAALPGIETLADSLCEHRFSFLGLQNKAFGPRINWHLEPTQEVEAPRIPGYRLDYRDVGIAGDRGMYVFLFCRLG